MTTIFRPSSQAKTSCPFFVSSILLIGIGLRLNMTDGHAQGTIYTDRSIYDSALLSSTTVTFESLSPSTIFDIGVSPITISGLTITNFEHRLFVASPGMIYPTPGTGKYVWNFDSSYPVGVFLPGGRNAFGADFSGGIVQNNPFNATITINLADGQTYTDHFTGQLGAWTFRGFVFSQPIASLVYDDGGPFLPGAHEEILDNVTFGVAVPEPKFLPMVLGCVIVGFLVRRLRPGARPS